MGDSKEIILYRAVGDKYDDRGDGTMVEPRIVDETGKEYPNSAFFSPDREKVEARAKHLGLGIDTVSLTEETLRAGVVYFPLHHLKGAEYTLIPVHDFVTAESRRELYIESELNGKNGNFSTSEEIHSGRKESM